MATRFEGLAQVWTSTLAFGHLLLTPIPMSAVVATRVKEMLSKMDMRCGGDFCDALDKTIEEAVKKAAWRSKENKRQTVYACDC